jgi:FdhD protein
MVILDLTQIYKIKRITSSLEEYIDDLIIVEKPLNIFINNQHYATLMCSTSDLEELAIGFIFSEGLILSIEDIEEINLKNDDMIFLGIRKTITQTSYKERALVSGCGRGSIHVNLLNENSIQRIYSHCNFNAREIINLVNQFNQSSLLFKQTGGVHSCCLCNEKDILYISEDIGRHNALDKLIGKCLKNSIELNDKLLITTGRISSDILIKAGKAGIPVVVSHSAPTNLAINMAKNINLTVIGFVRGNRMNIYCGQERIIT